MLAGKDKGINPDLERWYAARANSHKVEVSGASDSVYTSKADGGCGSDQSRCISEPVEEL